MGEKENQIYSQYGPKQPARYLPVIPDVGPIQTFLTSEPLMHEQVRCFTEKLGKAHCDVDQTRNWSISYSVWLGRGNQKVFPRNAFEMEPGFSKSKNCTPISTLELLQGYLGLSLCHPISFPTSVLVSQDTQKSSEAVFGANLNWFGEIYKWKCSRQLR